MMLLGNAEECIAFYNGVRYFGNADDKRLTDNQSIGLGQVVVLYDPFGGNTILFGNGVYGVIGFYYMN